MASLTVNIPEVACLGREGSPQGASITILDINVIISQHLTKDITNHHAMKDAHDMQHVQSTYKHNDHAFCMT